MSKTSINHALIDRFMANVEKEWNEKLAELKNEILRKKNGSSDHCKPNQNLQDYNRARPRKEQGLTPKPPDHTTWSSLQKIPHTPKSESLFYSNFQTAYKLFKFSGKGDYLEWEKNMEEWLYYRHIPRKERLAYAVSQLTGDAYKWLLKEVEDRWYYKEPTITSWRELKNLLRNKYGPKEPKRASQANSTVQGFAVQEKKPALAPEQNKPTNDLKSKKPKGSNSTSLPLISAHCRMSLTLTKQVVPSKFETFLQESQEVFPLKQPESLATIKEPEQKLPDETNLLLTPKQRTRENSFDVGALQGAYLINQKDLRGESSCYRFFSHQVITSNQFEAKISSELKVINFTNQVILRMPSSQSHKIGSLQAYIWRPGECSKLSIYAFRDLFINFSTGIMHLYLSNESNTDFRKDVKRTRKIFKREEDDRFKPSVLD